MHDNDKMGLILSFFAEHSPSIIKLLSVVVAVGASVLLYRVIFTQNVEAVAGPTSADLTDVNKKLNEQKIEIDTLKSENESTKEELEKQRTEVYNLRQTIKEKDIEVETVKAENLQLKTQTDETKKADYEKHQSEVILSTSDENLVFQKEISELKRRLSDYEIIAEDISDMQKLKEENEKLKALVSQAGRETSANELAAEIPDEPNAEIVVAPPAPAPETSELTTDAIAELTAAMADQSSPSSAPAVDPAADAFRNPSADAPVEFVPNESSLIETEVLGPGPGDETANVEEILAEVAKAAEPPPKKKKAKSTESIAVVVEASSLGVVSEVDKNLLDKFEKQKGS